MQHGSLGFGFGEVSPDKIAKQCVHFILSQWQAVATSHSHPAHLLQVCCSKLVQLHVIVFALA